MLKLLFEPGWLLLLGILFTGAGTILAYKIQNKEQSELARRADEIAELQRELRQKADKQAESQLLLRQKSDEIAILNHQIADSQRILREKAEIQADSQLLLREKSEENALLNSQVANIQRVMRERAEKQIEEQNHLRQKTEEISNLSQEIIDNQRKHRADIYEIRSVLSSIIEASLQSGTFSPESSEKLKKLVKRELQLEGLTGRGSVGTIKISLSSTRITILKGQTGHTFDGNLSIAVNIIPDKNKDQPILNAMILSPGKKMLRVNTGEAGSCFTYEEYSIKVESITFDSAVLYISLNDACGEKVT